MLNKGWILIALSEKLCVKCLHLFDKIIKKIDDFKRLKYFEKYGVDY